MKYRINRQHFRSVSLGILALSLLVSSACGGSDEKTEKAKPSESPLYNEKALITDTQAVTTEIVTAIEAGDTAALLSRIEENVRLQIGEELDLTSPQVKELARALAEAKPVKAYPGIVFYETALGGETLSFYIIEEEGTWKLGGL
ncbi:MAG: hypothetical protein PHV74_05360 [Dehalococcoidia bacterium]|nr:hypothetical protein [Dehalococcoidia bacterium]